MHTHIYHFLFQRFPTLLEQQLKLFDAACDDIVTHKRTRKQVVELEKEDLRKIDGAYYWIAGTDQIFLINHEISEENSELARLLTAGEVKKLPQEFIFIGPKTEYSDNEDEAFRLLVKIIELMNEMQEKDWWSYPLGNTTFGIFCWEFC